MKHAKRITAICLAAMLSGCMLGNPETLNAISDSVSITANAATASGTCGTNLRWSLSGDTLTITGSGTQMTDYNQTTNKAPWKTYASQVKKVILPKTLKKIGNYAFWQMSNLEYLYTANGSGSNSPVFPDLTYIGRYAFADCYKFRGNTENGKLTLGMGTSSVIQGGSIRVCDSAFQNCDKVRFLYVNYASMYVESWGFYNMNMLSSVQASNTTLELKSRAFYRSSALSTVKYKPSVKPIHNDAFTGTAYETNGCTNEAFLGQDFGSAKKMKGKQLIVNFFLDMAKVNTNGDNVREGIESTIFPLKTNEIAAKGGTSSTGKMKYYAFDKNNITYSQIFSWNAKKTSTQTNNTAVSLNKLDYSAQSNPQKIPKNVVDNSATSGFFGSNVTSADITERLEYVRSAANDLEQQVKNYNTASLKFEMHPETNFYLTYDSFDWTTTQKTINGVKYNIMGGYSNGANYYLHNDKGYSLPDSVNNPVFSALKKASQQHTGGVTQTIDLFLSSGSVVSSYTNYLKQHYGVDGVVYLLHFKNEGRSWSNKNDAEHICKPNRGIDEFSFIHSDSRKELVVEHEMCHLYGAEDFYNSDFSDIYKDDIMVCKAKQISPVTAYFMGWLDRLDQSVWNATKTTVSRNRFS